ncbi:developmental pluripotency-associated protein 2 [Echinops telfairi]|uniref:Developmental pluripotency-associated protein 2 n=1 Tax=Echinops telfairi TaxID=9371 RepID=A0ABM0IS64_ECHTE|nr:developmental pluripotency-associated protein 2 [Echinops telfairi]
MADTALSCASVEVETSAYVDMEKNYFESELDEESFVITLVPVKEEPNGEQPSEQSVLVPPEVKPKKPRKRNKVHLPQTSEQAKVRRRNNTNIDLPLPDVLPPVTEVHRDTLRKWCQQAKLSTDGQKVEVYLRLQKFVYPHQKQDVPDSPRAAKIQSISRKRKIKQPTLEDKQIGLPETQVANVVEVDSPAPEATLASWARISSKALQPKAVNSRHLHSAIEAFLAPGFGSRWCVVHGKTLPAETEGWVRLQFHAGQTWVPSTPRRMISLFLLPAYVFPPLDVEDNMLCPECVKRNEVLMKKLTALSKTK